MTWNPYRIRAAADGFRLTYSWWERVPDGRGCVDWDEFTEDVDGPAPLGEPYTDRDAAQAVVDRLNAAWHAAEAERKARQRAAPLP